MEVFESALSKQQQIYNDTVASVSAAETNLRGLLAIQSARTYILTSSDPDNLLASLGVMLSTSSDIIDKTSNSSLKLESFLTKDQRDKLLALLNGMYPTPPVNAPDSSAAQPATPALRASSKKTSS